MHRFPKSYRGLRTNIAVAFSSVVLAVGLPLAACAAASGGPAGTMVAGVPQLRVQDMGRVPRAARIDVAIALKYRHEDELEAFIRATSDPYSPEYGHFLSSGQFAAGYAPSVAAYARVRSTLVGAGFTLGATSANRTVVDASAPAAVAERFFGTILHTVKQNGTNGVRYANATPAYLPVALRDVVYGVAGLNNLVVAKAQNLRAPARRVDAALGPPLQGPDTGLSPFALASAYDFPVQHLRPGGSDLSTFDGTGHAAGIAIDADLDDTDIAAYLEYFQVKRTGPPLVRVKVDGGSRGDSLGAVETTLDVETIAGLAPGAALYLYLMPILTTVHIIDTYAAVVADDKIDVLNSSFGGCEISDDNFSMLSDHVAKQGTALGITFSAASGDYGAATCETVPNHNLGVSAPASNPHFTAVGGTSLLISPDPAYKAEFAWHYSGGGVSTIFGLPRYQQGLANIIGASRNVPDIAFDGDPNTGSAFFYQGRFQGPIGGTSLSSPIFCALLTEFNQTISHRSGNINYALYASFKRDGYGIRFRDITIGNNAYAGPGYNASPGYDNVTGIGSVIGTAHAK